MWDRDVDGGVREHRLGCPFCGERQTVLLDLSAGEQSYIEDCQVCCQPMQIALCREPHSGWRVEVDCAS